MAAVAVAAGGGGGSGGGGGGGGWLVCDSVRLGLARVGGGR